MMQTVDSLQDELTGLIEEFNASADDVERLTLHGEIVRLRDLVGNGAGTRGGAGNNGQ